MSVGDSVREFASWVSKEMHEPGYGVMFEDGDSAFVENDGTVLVQASDQGRHSEAEWLEHPAIVEVGCWFIRVARGAVDGPTLEAVLAAGVGAHYARAAYAAGVTDARSIIEGWEAGTPIEYLGAAL